MVECPLSHAAFLDLLAISRFSRSGAPAAWQKNKKRVAFLMHFNKMIKIATNKMKTAARADKFLRPYNENNVTRRSEREFVEQMRAQIKSGFAITPFIGSGCSSSSGILMGSEFANYLAYVLFICVAPTQHLCEQVKLQPNALLPKQRHNLERDGWPKQPTPEAVGIARKWIFEEFKYICERCGLKVDDKPEGFVSDLKPKPNQTNASSVSFMAPEHLARALHAPLLPPILRANACDVDDRHLRQLHSILGGRGLRQGGLLLPGTSPTSEDAITERAVRSLHDWRSTLSFLSELRLTEQNLLAFDKPSSSIIDKFAQSITFGRKPNLTHTMLCHLAGPARFRAILTTNFDELIESAFKELHTDIQQIAVGPRGALPDPDLVHSRMTIIKLHGTFSDTRADFSLDDSPAPEDKRVFFNYVRGRYPGTSTEAAVRYIPSQLLVAGYSGNDNRCVEMIKYVLDTDPDAVLFWVCYSEQDIEYLDNLFVEKAYRGRVYVTVTERVDLLLYEFYQRLCLCLPPGGFSYQFTPNAPPEATFDPPRSRAGYGKRC